MREPATLTVQVHRGASRTTVIEAIGDIDMASAAGLRRELLAGVELGPVVLDAANVAFCDSAGLGALAEARQAARTRGTYFRLAALSAPVVRVLELAGALEVFDIFPDVETALKD